MVYPVTFNPSLDYIVTVDDFRTGITNRTTSELMLPGGKGTLVNGVGAGDSMVAGFLAGWAAREDYGYAFRMGLAAGSASAFSEYLATKDEVAAVCAAIETS